MSAATAGKTPPGRPPGKTAGAATRGRRGGQGVGVSSAADPNSGTGPPRRGRRIRLTPMRVQAAQSMAKLADRMKEANPDLAAHAHVRDAARTLRAGNEEAAQRHLRAAMFALTPQSLHRTGLHTDDAHNAARDAMHAVHRHLLLVKDIEDAKAKNEQAIGRASFGDDTTAPETPSYGGDPGALAQKPVARQPGGNRALNAPARTTAGKVDANVADPKGKQRRGSKQFTRSWDDLAGVVDLAFHFNPLEKRNARGEWSGPDPDDIAKDIEHTGKMWGRWEASADADLNRKDAIAVHARDISKYADLVRAGKYHEAADKLEADANGRDKTFARWEQEGLDAGGRKFAEITERMRKHAADLRTVRRPDPEYTARLEQENAHLEDRQERRLYGRRAAVAASYGWDELAGAVVELAFDPAQPRDGRGRWTQGGHDPQWMIGVGGGRKNWANEENQPPGRDVRRDFPAVARREALVTPLRTFQAQMDDTRISGGQPPLHPELAEVFPAVYAKGGITWDGMSRLKPGPRVRARHDPETVTRLKHPPAGAGNTLAITNEIRTRNGLGPLSALGSTANVIPPGYRRIRTVKAAGDSAATELSARTAMLEHTPAPRGRPGGPGLYDVKNLQHTPYFQNVVKALIEKRGMPPGKAYAIAYGALRKWAAKSKHPEVRAAATGALAGEKARGAMAKAVHGHAVTWDDLAGVVELSWAVWNAERRGMASETAHDTASATAKADYAAKRGASDGYTSGLSDLADKLDSDHPGEGLGAHVREARDAAAAGDADTARQHLQAAQDTLRQPRFYQGGRGDATYRHASGNTFLLQQKQKQLPAAMGMAGDWSQVAREIELAVELTGTAAGAAKDQRIPAGNVGGGQFGTQSQGAKPQGKQQQGKQQQGKGGGPQSRKAALLAQAKADRAKAYALMKRLAVLRKALASAAGKTTKGQKGSKTTAKGSTTKTTASKTAATKTTAAAAQTAAMTKAAAASVTPAQVAAVQKTMNAKQMKAAISQLTKQIKTLLAQAAAATAQAAKL